MTEKPGTDTTIYVASNCRSCDWCSVLMGFHEASTSETVIGDDPPVTWHLCYTCREFESKALMEEAKLGIIREAINPETSELYNYPWT